MASMANRTLARNVKTNPDRLRMQLNRNASGVGDRQAGKGATSYGAEIRGDHRD